MAASLFFYNELFKAG